MEDFDWNVHMEGQLLEAMIGHKPVGINKHFQMALICDKFGENKDFNSENIWKHLAKMYNLKTLDESESVPFPNTEKDFQLPDSEFAPLIVKKEEDKKTAQQKGRETPKGTKEMKKEDSKTPARYTKDIQRRDSKDSREKNVANIKKEAKKELDRGKNKGKNHTSNPKDDKNKSKSEEAIKVTKRPTRGSLKPDDSNSSGKSSPVTIAPSGAKRRRI